MKRLGIFGGTFDPPHLGHLIIAQTALYELKLDKILFIPCGNPPHKSGRSVTDAVHRFAMVNEMIRSNDRFEVSDIEILTDAPSYTAETLKRLKEQAPDTEFVFIVGADSLAYMKNWWHPEDIFSRCTVAVAVRHGINESALEKAIGECIKLFHAKICRLNMPMIDISSSEIRRCGNLEKFRYLLSDTVIDYVIKHNLY